MLRIVTRDDSVVRIRPKMDTMSMQHAARRSDVWVHCASGYPASIAPSQLHRTGRAITFVDDAWIAAGLQIVTSVDEVRSAGSH